jgi:hypothetical protein
MKANQGFFITDTQRQHINLTYKAMAVIESDMIRFNNDYNQSNRSGFMNTIIQHYYQQFPLAKNVVLKEVNAIKKAIKSDDFSDKVTHKVIEVFTDEMMKNAIESFAKKASYDVMFKLKLGSDNASLLRNLQEVQYFDQYAPRSGLGFYLKVLLESYTELPKEKREAIYFADKIDMINKAIAEDQVIVLNGTMNTRIRPLTLVLSPNGKHNILRYITLLGEEKRSLYLYEISLKELASMKPHLDKGDDSDFWQDIEEYDYGYSTLFVSRIPKEKVIVEFTDSGLQRFLKEEDSLDMIGIPDQTNPNRYTFHATEPECYYQLFKFGPQAIIIEPLEIKERFEKLYLASFNLYQSMNKGKV